MSRSLLRETIGYRQIAEAQELPSRRRSFWALTTSLMAGNGLSEGQVGQRTRSGTHPAVREIHKNAWLKRQVCTEKKPSSFSKKGEKFWVVFCVHDDVEAFLEFYSEPKMAAIHKPLSAMSLTSCLHVSPSIIGQDNEYQFAVTLQSEVIRLVAANWEQMIEWVESLQGKLREMNILSPKDNLYSKLPETKLPTVASTRDPNSPLPPTPSSLAGGIQRAQIQFSRGESGVTSNLSRDITPREDTHSSTNGSSRLSVNGNSSSNPVQERESSRGSHHQCADVTCNPPQTPITSAQIATTIVENGESSDHSSQSIAAGKKSQINVKLSVDVNNIHRTSSGNIIQNQQRHQFSSGPVASTSTTVVVIGNGDVRIHNNPSDSSSSRGTCSASVTVNCSSTSKPLSSSSEQTVVKSTNLGERQQDETRNSGEEVNPCVSRVSVNHTELSRQQQRIGVAKNEANTSGRDSTSVNASSGSSGGSKAVKSTSSENIYEHIYIPERPKDRMKQSASQNGQNHNKLRSQLLSELDGRNRVQRSSSQRSPEEELPSGSARESHARRLIKGSSSGSSQRSSSLGRIDHPSTSNQTEHSRMEQEGSRRNANRNRPNADAPIRAVGNSTFFENNASPHLLQGSPIDALIGCRSGEYRLRRDEYLIQMGAENDNQSNASSQNCADPLENSKGGGSLVPLKEQQVLHLQMEINHPGGVRIILRKKDCLNSIAFVDYLGAVWVAGWKQTQYPVLYYAFHVGDQILKVAGVNVQSSIEASRAIKMVSSMQVEFIIRRLPYGKVFALKRSRDGEPLGLVAEGGSGEISEVLPEGLAARYGVPAKGISVDGQTPCNWYLTEVNNRPLSLMSKENEVKDRLNAVGKEISILVQPADLVKHLRKSLKSFKSFKEYVVG